MCGKTSKGRWILFSLMACGFCGGPFVSGATLTGTFTDIPQGAVVNLTVEGPLDWVHWGLVTETSVDRKAGVAPVIPDFKPLGLNGPYPYGDNFNSYSWSDGTPTANVVSTTTGVWMYGRTNGFEIDVPADTKQTTLKVYVGTFAAVGNFEATLSGTALKYTNASISNMSNGPGGCYALNFSADSPGQTLVVKYTVGRTFAADGNVTLQAAALTAPGANNPPAVSIANPTDGANFSAHDNIRIAADAADADGTIVKVEFFQKGARLGESLTSPYSLIWSNVPAGRYVLTARATDDGDATAASAPVEIFVSEGGGTLSGSSVLPPASVDLTAEGTSDWAHWGLTSSNSFDHKAGVPQQISNFTGIGTNDAQQYSDNYTAFSWTDGTPTASTNGTKTGIFIHGLTNGFLLTAPADTGRRTLKVYLGLYGAQGEFHAYLSDFSAPAYSDTSLSNVFGNAFAVYTLNYAAASAGQILVIKYTVKTLYDADFGNVTLQAATLSGGSIQTNSPPVVTINSPTNNATFNAGANITIQATASDSDGSVAKVEFFAGATLLGSTTNSPYTFTWNSVPAGNYSLTAKATDNWGALTTFSPVNISVANSTATAVSLINPVWNGSDFSFSFATVSSSTYTVQYTDSLNPISWQSMTNFAGNGTAVSVTNITTATQRFYRVETQ